MRSSTVFVALEISCLTYGYAVAFPDCRYSGSLRRASYPTKSWTHKMCLNYGRASSEYLTLNFNVLGMPSFHRARSKPSTRRCIPVTR